MIWVKLGGKIIQIAKKQLDKWLSKGAKIVKEPKKETTKAVDKSPNPTELFNKFRNDPAQMQKLQRERWFRKEAAAYQISYKKFKQLRDQLDKAKKTNDKKTINKIKTQFKELEKKNPNFNKDWDNIYGQKTGGRIGKKVKIISRNKGGRIVKKVKKSSHDGNKFVSDLYK